MAYKDYYEYNDIVEATGKSYSAIKNGGYLLNDYQDISLKGQDTCYTC